MQNTTKLCPINNDAEYNKALIKDLVYIDYVDAKGVSCIYGVKSGEKLKRLQEIAGLKVYFIAGTTTGKGIISQQAVTAPYYTVSGTTSYGRGFAIPLNNAFRVKVETQKQEQVVASYNFTFELTQPELDITRVNGEKAIWDNEKNILSIYGDKAKVPQGKEYAGEYAMFVPLYEAFTTAYAEKYKTPVPNAQYYKLSSEIDAGYGNSLYRGHVIIDDTYQTFIDANLSEIDYSANATGWNTYTINMDAIGAGIPIYADYHFYGVYPATDEQVPDFTLRFASLLGDAKDENIVTKEPDYTVHNVTREVILDDEDFTLVDALGDKFYLFNGVKSDGNIDTRSEMNRRQGFEEGTEGFEKAFTLATAEIKVKDVNGTDITSKFEAVKEGTIAETVVTEIKEDGTVTVPKDKDVAFYVNEQTKTRGWAAQTATDNTIIVTDLPAKQADKTKGYAAIPGGIMIQLPKSIGTTEPVTLEFTLVDVFGVTKTLSVTVQAAK